MIVLRFSVLAMSMIGVLALAAGRVDVWSFWAWVGTVWLSAAIIYTNLASKSPELVAERMKPPSDRDRHTRRHVALLLPVHLLLAGLDVRFAWSQLSFPLQLAGLLLVALGFALVGWVLLTNPFASSAVRIQEERGQEVISTGPYSLVRHPMYLAVVLVCLGSGPALGSWPAGLALLPILGVFVRRTLLEDRMLQRELPGYASYATRVRWRVVPLLF